MGHDPHVFARLNPRLKAILFPAFILGGCALLHPRPQPWPLPALEAGPTGRWVQSLALERRGRSLELLAVIENDGKTLTLVGLSPMGQRLVRIVWTDAKVAQESDPNLPVPIDGEAILRDVVFVNWPEPALAAVFAKTNWRARFEGSRRSLAWGDRTWLTVGPQAEKAGDAGETGSGSRSDSALTHGQAGGHTVDHSVDHSVEIGRSVVVDHVVEDYQVRVTTVEREAP